MPTRLPGSPDPHGTPRRAPTTAHTTPRLISAGMAGAEPSVGAATPGHPAIAPPPGPLGWFETRLRFVLRVAEDMGQEHQSSAEAIVGNLVDVAAEYPHEAAQLPARLVENPGRTPALRASHDRGVAVVALHARKFAGNEIEGALQRHRNKIDRELVLWRR